MSIFTLKKWKNIRLRTFTLNLKIVFDLLIRIRSFASISLWVAYTYFYFYFHLHHLYLIRTVLTIFSLKLAPYKFPIACKKTFRDILSFPWSKLIGKPSSGRKLAFANLSLLLSPRIFGLQRPHINDSRTHSKRLIGWEAEIERYPKKASNWIHIDKLLQN